MGDLNMRWSLRRCNVNQNESGAKTGRGTRVGRVTNESPVVRPPGRDSSVTVWNVGGIECAPKRRRIKPNR